MNRDCVPGCEGSDCQCADPDEVQRARRLRHLTRLSQELGLYDAERLEAWWRASRAQECAVCGGPWDGHVTLRELTAPSDGYYICGPCDRGEQPEYDEVDGGFEYVRNENPIKGTVTWGWAFVSRSPSSEQTRAQQSAMRNPEAMRG